MIKKLSKHGNGRALVLDRAVLDLLKINDDTNLEITTNGHDLIIKPLSAEENNKLFLAALAETNRKHAVPLQELADS